MQTNKIVNSNYQLIMEYDQISLSINPNDFIESKDFIDELGLEADWLDNSDSNEMVFGLSW